MKKRLLLICLLATCFGSLLAGPVNQQKAQKVGVKFLSTTAVSEKNADIQLSLVSVAANRDAADYYVFNVSNGEGFVIVSADDRVKPILAYSTTGSFNPDNIADGFAFTLSNFQKEIQYIREHNISATPDITAEWKSVKETGHLQKNCQARAVVGPRAHLLYQTQPTVSPTYWAKPCCKAVSPLKNNRLICRICLRACISSVLRQKIA